MPQILQLLVFFYIFPYVVAILSIAYFYFYLNFLLIVCKVTEVLMHF